MPTIQQLIARVSIDTSDLPAQLNAASSAMQSGIGTAAQQAQLRIDSLSERIGFQSRQLSTLGADLAVARTKFGEDSAEVDRLKLSFDRLSASIGQNERQLAISQQRIGDIGNSASGAERFVTQFGQSASSSILSIIGPTALATAGVGALIKAAQGFEEAFEWKTQLDANIAGINIQLKGVRDSTEVWQQAANYAERYKLTQQETTEAIQSSLPVIRDSKASIEEVLGVFDRLKLRSPEKTFQDAARALSELQAGQYTSINRIFNVPLAEAHQMSEEIKKGGDAVQIVSKYLTDQGIGMDALKVKTEGASGAIKDQQIAWENLKKAEAGESGGLGLALMQTKTNIINALTNALSANGNALYAAAKAGDTAYNNALANGATKADALKAKEDARAATLARISAATGDVAAATFRAADQDDRIAASLQKATVATSDFVDVSKLTEEQLQKLQDKLESTTQSAASAYQRIGEAQKTFQDDSRRAATDHERKIDDIQKDADKRRDDLVKDAASRQSDVTQNLDTKLVALARETGNQIYRLDRSTNQATQDDQASHAAKLLDIQEGLARRIEDSRRDSARRIADLESQIADERAQRTTQIEQQLADRREQIQSAYNDRVRDFAQRELDIEAATAEARTTRAQALAERLEEIQRASNERLQAQAEDRALRAADQLEDRQTRLQDQAEDRARAAEDAAQAHADKLEEIRRKAEQSGSTGSTVALDGSQGTVAIPGSGSDSVQAQIDAENKRYEEAQARALREQQLADQRAERDYQRQQERAARAQARADAAAALALQRQIEQAQQQAAAQEAAAAEQQRKQEEALAKQRQAQEAAYQQQLADADAQAAKQREQFAQTIADHIAKLSKDIADERDAQALRESDATAAAERSTADEQKRFDDATAKRQAHYDQQRADLIAAMNDQIASAQAAHDKQQADIADNLAKQLAKERQAAAERLAAENESYAAQQADRQAAFDKQQTQLEEALGKQLLAVTEAQKNLGLITKTEADRRDAIVHDSYLKQVADAQAAFAAFANNTFADGGDRRNFLSDRSDTASSGGAVSVGQINVYSNNADPAAVARETRAIFLREIAANGGDVSTYFGGP